MDFRSPADAIAAGIGVVYQELSLFPALSIGENVLGARALGSRWVRWGEVWRVAESALLFRSLHALAAKGTSFVLVSHILEEVIGNADRVTVLRDGRLVCTTDAHTVTKPELVDLMMGTEARVLRSTYEGEVVTLPAGSTARPILEVKGLIAPPMVRGVDIAVRPGEILGIYGDLGSGHIQLAEAVFGLLRVTHGAVMMGDDPRAARSPTHARDSGLGFLPLDRHRALAVDQPIYRNVTLAALHRIQGWVLNTGAEIAVTSKLIADLGITNAVPSRAVGHLSGGNQQKVLLARWLVRPPRVLILIEPTRGMDVHAKSEVIRIVRQLQEQGVGILLVSTEPETVLAMAQRVLVMRRGRVISEFVDCQVDKRALVEAAA